LLISRFDIEVKHLEGVSLFSGGSHRLDLRRVAITNSHPDCCKLSPRLSRNNVKPYVKRGKNDAADAEAICEVVTRPTMRFVSIKSPEQQSAIMLHRVSLIPHRQRTQLTNAMRAHMAEFGIVAPIGRGGIDRLLAGRTRIATAATVSTRLGRAERN